jgi:hypothetical protein
VGCAAIRYFERLVLIAATRSSRSQTLRRLAATFANACLEKIEDARVFVQIDEPDGAAELIREFVATGP